MKVIKIESDKRACDSYVHSVPGATAYHQFCWKGIIEKSFGHDCYYLAAVDDASVFQGILPLVHMNSKVFGNFLVSVPFVNYGGLLSGNIVAADHLLREAERIRSEIRADHVELRHLGHFYDGLPTKRHKVTMILDLADEVESQWKGFNAKLPNQIRKPEKSGLSAIAGNAELLDDFYDVFARNMRDLGTPVYSKHFFRNFLAEFPDETKIIAVKSGTKTIAAGIAYWFRDTIEVPWASSIRDYKQLCPNNMLYWEAIKFAIDHGFSNFDFGRSTPDEGTYKFKEQWGARPVQLHWQYLLQPGKAMPEISPNNPKYEMAIAIWQKLPVALTRIIGPRIVRNIP